MATVECPSCRTSNPSEALYCSACGAATHRSDGDELIGLTVGGRYHLVEKIGQGSAGTLYRAEHVTLRRRMAVKLLHKQLALSEEAVERFRREAITVCEIDNDHIPQVHDFGRTEDDQLFFAMEFLDGETLSSVLEREGRVSPERAADILSQIADGLMEAHTLGYVHRDLRPRSIFLTRRRGRQDFVKILDFGLAKLVQPEIDAQRTAMGMTYGDPRYMAPEQARGEAADRRADIYSLGVLGFEMLVGEPPFKGGGTFEVLQKVLDAPVPRLRERRSDCPPWLESVIRTALAKRPAERFQTVAQLLDALERKQVLANQPPMPLQLTSQQASKLAGVKDSAAAARTGSAAQVQVFVSSPALRPIQVTGEAAAPGAGSTQAMPTVAPRTTVPGQGPGQPRPNQPAAASPTTASPRTTMSYPAVKLARSGTAPGVNEPKPGPTHEPPALTGESRAGASSEIRLLGERLPAGDPGPARPAAAKPAPAARPAAVGPAAAKPSLLIAPTTPPRNDPTPRTARAMLEQEVMAWEEAAQPVLHTADLTDAASMSEPTGRAPSADTPVEEMKFGSGTASAASPGAVASAVAPRPISAPAIAAMRSMFPGPGGPKSSEPIKAQPAPAPTAATTRAATSANVGEKAAAPAVTAGSASAPAASKPAPFASAPEVSRSAPGLSTSGLDVSKSASGASGPGISKAAAASKSGDRIAATKPTAAASEPTEGRADPERATGPSQRLAAPLAAAASVTQQPIATRPVAAPVAPIVAPAEPVSVETASSGLAGSEDEEDAVDATIPQIRVSTRDDETPIIVHNPASARSPAASSLRTTPTTALPAGDVETTLLPKTTGEQQSSASHDTPKDAVETARSTGAESNWFSTPAASATDAFAADEGEVATPRRRPPTWALAVAAGSLLLVGVVYLASRSPAPISDPSTHSTGSPAPGPTQGANPTAVVPQAAPPPLPAATPEVARPESVPVRPIPEVTPLPVATAIPAPSPGKPVPSAEPSPSGAETRPGPADPRGSAATTKENKPAIVAANPATAPEPQASAQPATKPASERPSAKAESKPSTEGKAKPAGETAKADPGRKGAAKPAKEPKEPKADPEAVAGKPEKAEKKPGEAGALVQNGKKKLEDGEPDAAAALFARAVELDPRSAEAIGGLGESYFEQGNFEAAARHLGKAARLAPRRAGYQELLVQALYKVNRYKEAADACRKLLKLDPGSAKAKQTLELAQKKLPAASN